VIPAVAPHAPYTVTPHLLHEAVSLAQEFDVPLHIHIAETAQEVEDHRKEYGMPPVPWLKKQGIFEARTSAAHCVHLDDGEINTLTHYNVGVAHNPSSNLKLASGIAPIQKMLDKGLNVGIGTDGPASNNDLDMFEEMRLTSFLGKVSTMDPTAIPARKTLEMATIMGARALHIDELTGSLEAGKRADLVVVRMDRVRHAPTYQRDPKNIYSRVVYTAHADDVQHSMVNGQWLMRDFQFLSLDPADLRAEANEMAEEIDAFLVKREESVLSKLLAIGGVDQEKTFEVQVKVHEHDLDELRERMMSTPEITVLRGSERDQYDTYFLFDDRWGSVLRYREDEVLDENGAITDAIYRLTLTTQRKEREYENSVLLSRSRFDAPATRSLRFYREYFAPETVIKVNKYRERYHIRYGNTEFAVNLDQLKNTGNGKEHAYFEIKSRTWSRQDAEHKAQLIGELLTLLDVPTDALVKEEYVQLVQKE
jgi:5-methylthioadenosine/S-adenosylhomocysteine deaminase